MLEFISAKKFFWIKSFQIEETIFVLQTSICPIYLELYYLIFQNEIHL